MGKALQKIDADVLDNLIVGRVEPFIYAFSTETYPNYLKVGDTSRGVRVRLDEWRAVFPELVQRYEHTARIDDETMFRDYAVHTFLVREKGRERLLPEMVDDPSKYSCEFFKYTSTDDIDEAIADIVKSANEKSSKYPLYSMDRQPKTYTYARTQEFEPRENQQQAIDNFKAAVAAGRDKLLLYAVMRFGKSFTSMCCATEIGARFVVIVSAKTDVEEEWKETVESHVRFAGFEFLNSDSLKKNDTVIADTLADPEKKVALFLSLQDLQGDKIKSKHKEVFDNLIDLLIVDETHFGARGASFGKVLQERKTGRSEKKRQKETDSVETLDQVQEAIKSLQARVRLHLSGTPYRILMSDEFRPEDIIAFVQFSDIIDAQQQWDRDNLRNESRDEWENPYFGFPQMIRFAFNPNKLAQEKLERMRRDGISPGLSELFQPLSLSPQENGSHRQFLHEAEVLDLLEVIDGTKEDENVLGFLDYDKLKEGKMCRHIVCVLPYKASCDAMAALLLKHRDKFKNLGDYEIINIAGFDDVQKYPSSGDVKRVIRENEKNDRKTISLTVNRMLTGTTVPEWDTMLFLKETSSPQDYDQAIFRLQNQYLTKYKDESGKTIVYNMKPQTLLVDFDPTRMFVLQEKKAQYYNVNTTAKGNALLKKRLARELEISPIIVVNKGKLQQVTPTDITDAVRAYSQSRSILDDAQDIPVDFSLLNDDAMTEILRTIEPVNSKNGLQIKPTEGEGTDIDTPDNNGAGDGNDENKDNATTPQPSDKPKEIDDIGKRLAAYYARILFFAFLTESTVKSLEEVIAQVSSSDDNRRIAHNVGLTEENLRFVFDKINPFVLDKLDYKIENVNDQMRDDTMTPMMRAEVAMHRFTRLSDSEIVTPLNVADDMVGLLPDDVFSKGPVLDIAAKQGEFAIALFKRYGKEAADKIYSVCTSKPAYEFTRKVYSLLSMPADHIFSDFTSYDLIKQDKKKKFIIPQAIKDMNFSAIIGNPPYHEVIAQKDTANGQKRSSSIFQHFQYVAETLGRYTNLIYPGGRWMHRSGKGMEQFGLSQINDSHLKLLKFFPDAKDVFLEAGVADGLSIVLKDSENSSDIFTYIYSIKGSNVVVNAEHPGDELFPMNPHSNRIVESLEKFIEKHACLHQSILSQKLFSIESDFVEKNPGLVREYNVGDDFDSVHEIKLFTNDKAGKAGRSRWYIANRKVITSGMEYLDKWKVIVSSANAGGQKRSNQIAIVDNHSAFGRSRVALKTFDTEKEAQNFFKYATSEIIRFAFLLTDESLTSLAKKVPDIIDYSDDNGIIDFTGNVDAQLYRLLDISEPDQMFIRKTLAEKSN